MAFTVPRKRDCSYGHVNLNPFRLMSVGLFVSNRAQTDAKAVQAMVNYFSKEAAVGTGRLLLAATDAAR